MVDHPELLAPTVEFVRKFILYTDPVLTERELYREYDGCLIEIVDVPRRSIHEDPLVILSYLATRTGMMRQGRGSRAMQMLTLIADECEVVITLSAIPRKDIITESALRDFYRLFGFKVVEGSRMVRRPKPLV